MSELTMMEARQRLAQLPEELAAPESGGAATITRHGKPVLAVVSWELYDSLLETLEILSDPELMKQLRCSIQEMQEGNTRSWQSIKRDLNL